jgi:YidC/Oxa1 family membrane protein insertase
MEERKFDANTAIGLLLIGAVLIYMTWSSGRSGDEETPMPAQTEEVVEESVDQETPSAAVEEMAVIEAPVADSTGALPNGILLPDGKAEAIPVVLENEDLRISFSSKGGTIQSVELKNEQTYFGDPLMIFTDSSFRYNMRLQMAGAEVNTVDQYFELIRSSSDEVVFGLRHLSGAYLELAYSLDENAPYQLNFSSRTQGNVDRSAEVEWNALQLRQEKSFKNEKNNTAIFYRSEGDVDDLGIMKAENAEEVSSADWLAFKGQFFTALFYTQNKMSGLELAQIKPEQDNNVYVAEMRAHYNLPLGDEETSFWYFGPNQYQSLKSYDMDLTEMIPLGWGIFGWINMWMVIPVFGFFESLGWNYGLIILIMAIGVKVVLSPFQIRSYISMAKMRVLKPEIDAINEKYDDQMKKQQAMMELYRTAGANPLGGCLPMLFQMPFLIAMFRFFPSSIELRGQSFLWADDLSSYDSILQLPFSIPFYGDHVSLFTILMAISMFFYTKFNQQMQPSTGGNQMAQQMKVISYMMPVMMLFWFNSYASGLSYYYFLANVISFVQQGVIRKFFIDEDAILAKMQDRQAQPKKKGKFQQRLDDMVKEQNRRARRNS